jgi:ankyrin repeat protein
MSSDQHTHGPNCNHTAQFGCEQTLDELQFENSVFNACVQGDLGKVKHLLEKKTSVNEQDKNGYTCLHYAARHERVDIVKLLLSGGYRADPNLRTYSCRSTALHRAAYVGNAEIVALLLASRASPYERDCDGKTGLHKCAERLSEAREQENVKKYERAAKCFLDFDVELIRDKDNNSKTPADICPDLIKLVK